MRQAPILSARILSLLFMLLFSSFLHAQTDRALWKRLKQAEQKDMPQTVMKIAGQIYQKAERRNDMPTMLKAYMYRTKYQQHLTPDSFYVHLAQLEQMAEQEQRPVERAVLHSLLAGVYADYAVSNIWAMNRASLLDVKEGEAPSDIREWSRNLFVERVIRHTRETFKDADRLLETNSRSFSPFVSPADGVSEPIWTDMYRTLSMRAFNTLGKLEMLDDDTQTVLPITRLYEETMQLYGADKEGETTRMFATLDFLRWRHDTQLHLLPPYESLTDEDFLTALDALIAKYGAYEACAEVYLQKARTAFYAGKHVEALQVCEEALKRYPAYKRIAALAELRKDILHPQLSISTDKVAYPSDTLHLSVSHCNLDGFAVNIYRVSPGIEADEQTIVDSAFFRKYTTFVRTVRVDLKRPDNYRSQDTLCSVPVPAEPGLYVLRYTPDGHAVSNEPTTVADAAFVRVTRFKLLSMNLIGGGCEVTVVDARSGQPISDTRMQLRPLDSRAQEPVQEYTVPASGRVAVHVKDGSYKLVLRKGDDTYILPRRYFSAERGMSYYQEELFKTRLQLLTDRSLYRPGQTIHVKGVAYTQQGDDTNILPNRNYEVVLYDANHKEIARKQVRTGDYGSFALQFVLPQNGLNGNYLIEAVGEERAHSQVRVEEYKRPTFEVSLNEPQTAYKAGDSLRITGKAFSYAGVAQQGARLSYTLNRTLRYWWGGYGGSSEQLSAGELTVDENGEFTIPVLLTKAKTTDKNNHYYAYVLDVSVTNTAGETQAGTLTLPTGERSVSLYVNGDKLLSKDKEIKLTFEASNLKRQPVEVNGRYRLVQHVGGKETECLSGTFVSNVETRLPQWNLLPTGEYELQLTAADEQGRPIAYSKKVVLFAYNDTRPPMFTDTWVRVDEATFDASRPGRFAFGTSHKDAYVLMDVFSNGKRIESAEWQLTDSIVHFEVPYKEMYGDGVGYLFTFVKNGKVFTEEVRLTRTLPDKELRMKWEVFRDKLNPGQKEEWKLTLALPDGKAADAEMLATLYDASLDKLFTRTQSLKPSYRRSVILPARTGEYVGRNYYMPVFARTYQTVPELGYVGFCDIADSWAAGLGIRYAGGKTLIRGRGTLQMKASDRMNVVPESLMVGLASEESLQLPVVEDGALLSEEERSDSQTHALRSDFSETAFFYPHLRTDKAGEVSFSFTMPESLTRWNFRGYAHSKDMLMGEMNATLVTVKEFMLVPNIPRFVRVGDESSVAATVTNLTGKRVRGHVTFELFEPETDKVIGRQRKPFAAEGGKSVAVRFAFKASDTHQLLGVRLVASGDGFSDGEQHLLPVLSDKEYIIETLTMPIRGGQEKTFALDKLFNGNSPSATHRKLTVEFTGNPAWYAVQALPVLTNPQYDNAMSWASAYYANSLAAYVAHTQPRISKLLDYWRARGARGQTFGSRLAQNEELKSILLAETPWVADADNEKERQERLLRLFDRNNFEHSRTQALDKLKDLQQTDGSWSWCKGMPGSSYVTEYVCLLLNRLNLLTGTPEDEALRAMKRKGFLFLHNEAMEVYRSMLHAQERGEKNLSLPENAMDYLYLWAVSNEQIPEDGKAGLDYLLSKVEGNLQGTTISRKAKSAIILRKAGRVAASDEFINSIKEHLTRTEEDGAFFAFNETAYRWGMYAVSVHVNAMEALWYAGGHDELVEEMKLWLLKQKKNTAWSSSVATSDAVYALLCRGTDLLASQGDVTICLGDRIMQTLQPAKTAVPDMGYLKESFVQPAPELNATSIVVEKRDEGVAWGAVYAGYLSPLSDVKAHGTGLGVQKKLYVERTTPSGRSALTPIDGSTVLKVGEKVVSRLTIRVDTAMDFVHLKDQRAACFEPEQALSGYRWSNGLGYYMEQKDVATNFFFASLSKGVYVLEHTYRVARSGTYEAGLAMMQCMYAPEYAAHAGSMRVKVAEGK